MTVLLEVIKNRLKILLSPIRVLLGYFSLSALTLILAGCSMIKRDHYDVPVVPLPNQFKNAPAAVSSHPDSSPSPDSKSSPAKPETKLDPVLTEWWHTFGNSELDDLINRGLANNADVRIATFRLDQAKIRADQSHAGKGPTISAPISANRQFPYYGVSGNPIQGIDGTTGPNGNSIQPVFQAGLRADWRMDLWGELDSLAQSANLQLWRASFERDNAQGNVAASIASSYIEYLSFNDRIRVARETETVLSGMVAAVEDRMESGDATAIDLEQQKAAVFAVRATIPALEQQRDDALGNIAFLLGTVPESLTLSDNGLDSLALPSVIPGVPSTLLLRRPDVRMAEARLLAADADIDVARARVLPPLDLTAQVGYGSYYLSELFKPQALFWNTMANLSITIFDGEKLSKETDYAKAVHEEMVETYVRTIYQAVREVDVSLNAIRQTSKRLEAQKASVDASHQAWDFNSEVYAVGANDSLVLMDSERTYHRNLDEYHRIRMDRYQALVNLFHALGGGVPQVETLPGKGVRPNLPTGSKGGVILDLPNNALAMEKVDWESNSSYAKENAWLVELPGLYHRKTIDAAWHDLQARFPLLMKDHTLHRVQYGKIEDSADIGEKSLSWYQLYIAKFPSAAAAEALCSRLRSNHQRCRVVLSRRGQIIVESVPSTFRMDNTLTASPPIEINEKPKAPDIPVSTPVKTPLVETAQTEISHAAVPAAKIAIEETHPVETPNTEVAHAEAAGITPSPATLSSANNKDLPNTKPAQEKVIAEQVYVVQLCTYRYATKALREASSWQTKGYKAYVRQYRRRNGRIWYKILVGNFTSIDEANTMASTISHKEGVKTAVSLVVTDEEGKPGKIIDPQRLKQGD